MDSLALVFSFETSFIVSSDKTGKARSFRSFFTCLLISAILRAPNSKHVVFLSPNFTVFPSKRLIDSCSLNSRSVSYLCNRPIKKISGSPVFYEKIFQNLCFWIVWFFWSACIGSPASLVLLFSQKKPENRANLSFLKVFLSILSPIALHFGLHII